MYKYQEVAIMIGEGEGWTTRSRLAKELGVHVTVAQSHLERAVRDGLLVKYEARVGKHVTWVYAHPSALAGAK